MAIELDHIILPVNDRVRSLAFYTGIVGLTHEGDRQPFSLLRVTPGFMIQIAHWGTTGGQHLAFAMSRAEFDAAFARLTIANIAHGDRFDGVGNMMGPGEEVGSQGRGMAIYCFDPDNHLVEFRHYEVA